MSTTRRSTFAALALGIVLVAGACSSDDNGGSSTSPADTNAATTAPSESTTASSEPGGTTATTEAGGETGGTVTYGAEQEFTSYNNQTADQVLFANTWITNLTQPGAFISEPDLTYKVDENLMDSVELTSEDPQVVTYKVKEGAVWSDGEPIDCDDFYLHWIAQNGKAGNQVDDTGAEVKDADGNPIPVFNAAGTFGYEDISSVECSDDGLTITATYAKKFADWQALFSTLMPAHIVEQMAGVDDVLTATDPKDIQALGTAWSTGFTADKFDPATFVSGLAYKIESFTPGETLILVRNDAYYGTPGNADSIVLRQVPSADDQPAALGNGDVQVITPQPNPDLLAQLEGIDGVTTEVFQGTTFEHIDFNQANPILADLAVRQAIAKCIDRQEIVDTLIVPLNPDATVLNNRFFIPVQPDYKDNSGDFAAQDIPGAEKLLTDAGWVKGSDGIYAKDGTRLSLRLGRRDPNPRRQSTNELMATQCKEAGIELTDDPAEDFNAVRLPASDYDIALFAWVASANISGSTSIYIPPADGGGQNWNNYSNPEVKTLFDAGNADLDPTSRAATMNQIDQILWDDMVTVPLFQFQDLYSWSDAIGNVSYNGPTGVTWNGQEWTVSA